MPTINSNLAQVVARFGAEMLISPLSKKQYPLSVIKATARRKLNHIVCGDFVYWEKAVQGNAIVVRLAKRKNALTRMTYRNKKRAIAANIDQLVIVNSWQPLSSWEFIDRYLIMAQILKTQVIIVMNKNDLQTAKNKSEIDIILQQYRDINYNVIKISTKTGENINQLYQQLANKTSIFVGQSGVGKSSLINYIYPHAKIKVNEISLKGEGKHTTTTSQLYALENNGYLIDSPGVRNFVLPDISNREITQGYKEFDKFSGDCHFYNCTHQSEPKCMIKLAVKQGHIAKERYQRYLKNIS